MTNGIIIREHGNPEVMKWGPIELPEVGPQDVLIKQSVVGLNFIDIYHRSGSYPLKLPSGIGMEAVGKVVAKGDLVKDINIGARVGYVMGSPGSYVEQRVFPDEDLINLPENISDLSEMVISKEALMEEGKPRRGTKPSSLSSSYPEDR